MTAQTTVTIAAVYVDGTPLANHRVKVRLIHGGAGGTVDGNLIAEDVTVKLDADGGSVDLYPTDAISPPGCFYRFTVDNSSPTIVRDISVPASGPVAWTDAAILLEDPVPPVTIPAAVSGTAGQVLGVVDPGDGPRYDLIDQTGGGAVDSVNGQTGTVVLDAEPLFFDLTGLGPTYALDLSAVPDAVKSVAVYCDTAIALTITPPVGRPGRLGLMVFVDGAAAISVSVVGGAFSLTGTAALFAYLEPLPSVVGAGMQLGPYRDPAVASVNGQAGTVVLDADDIGDGTTNKAYTATEKTKLASLNLPFTTGDYYSLSGGETASTAPALSPAGVLQAHPVYLQAGNYDRFAMYVATAAVSTYRLGVYPNDAATYKPDGQRLILDAGTLNMNAGTGIQQITVTLAIPTSGIYWLAVLCDSYTAKPSIVGWVGNPGVAPNVPYFGNIVYGNVPGRSPFGAMASSVATGAMPTTFPTTTRTDVLPQITVRKAT